MTITRTKGKPRFKRLPHRCGKCWKRVTLAKPLAEYIRPPKCKGCGSTKLFLCKDRLPQRWGRKKKCNCGGWWFPHRKGCKGCYESPTIEQDILQRQGEQ